MIARPAFLMVALVLASCKVAPSVTPGASAEATPLPSGASVSGGFTLGIEYALPGLAQTYARAAVSAAKPAIEYGLWGNLEPQPGVFEWRPLDALVAEYQAEGVTQLQILLSAESPWASRDPPKLLHRGDTFPKDLAQYAAFVTRVVERYDGDGLDDAPGLVTGIHEWGVEREFTGFWPGSAADYVTLLRTAAPAIRAADSGARVLLVAILAVDVFNGAPNAATVDSRWQTPRDYRKSRADVETILAACDSYDVVDFHSLGDWTEIPSTAAWLRDTGERLSCPRPIVVGDAFSMSALVAYGDPFGIVAPLALAPASDATRDAVIATLEAVGNATAPDHEAATVWLRAELARGLVRKAAAAAGEGLIGINLGNQEDWLFNVRAFGTANYMGISGATRGLASAGAPLPYQGEGFSRVHAPGDLRPAYAALTLAAKSLAGTTGGERLSLPDGAVGYRLDRPNGTVWVLWADDGALHLPGDAGPSVSVQLDVGVMAAGAGAVVTRTPTDAVDLAPSSTTVPVSATGTVVLTLDAAPLFVELGS